jgi:hypothetical protein
VVAAVTDEMFEKSGNVRKWVGGNEVEEIEEGWEEDEVEEQLVWKERLGKYTWPWSLF